MLGVAAALIMLVSKYGFSDVLVSKVILLDPSRVAAQIVSGIGFLGTGLIFVRREVVNGADHRRTIWLVVGIGMACGGGLAGLAAVVTALYFIAHYALPALVHRLPRIGTSPAAVRLAYEDGRGVLRHALETCTLQGFSVAQIDLDNEFRDRRPGVVDVALVVSGRTPASVLAASLEEIEGVLSVAADDSSVSEN